MLFRCFLTVVALAFLPIGAVWAKEASFEDRVRDYLLENPEVILEALEILSERERIATMQARVAMFPELFTDPWRLGMGKEDAPIHVIEFFDYKCAPCKAVHPVLLDFVKKTPQVRIEMRQLPILSPGSERAARFALAVQATYGNEAYAEVNEQLWEVRGPLGRQTFERIARDLGLDFAALEPIAEGKEITERITYNRDLAIALEILGTPAFVTKSSVIFGTTDIDNLAQVWLNQ